jgi:hypothetical protein
MVAAVQADPIDPTLPPPPGGWSEFGVCNIDVDNAEFYHYGYWDGTGPNAQVEANYGPPVDVITIAGPQVEVVLDNDYFVHNHKVIHIKITGTGATGAPENVGVAVINDGGDPSPHEAHSIVEASEAGGTWTIEIIIVVGPQPDQVIITFTVPGAPVLDEAWLAECCQRPTIPSMTTYGLGILAILLLASGYFAIRRRRAMVQ